MSFAWTIVALVVVMAVAWRFLGCYMAAVFEGRVRWLSFIERPVYRITGVDPESEQTWQRYDFTSVASNNGSAFAGIDAKAAICNIINTIGLLLGRFAIMVPVLAQAGTLAAKESVHASAGTFRTDSPMFMGLLAGVILIVGALTVLPAVSLGPIVERFSQGRFF